MTGFHSGATRLTSAKSDSDSASPILNRRRLVAGAAWAAPAITVVSAAPAFAATGGPATHIGAMTVAYDGFVQSAATTITNGVLDVSLGPITVDAGSGVGVPAVLFSIDAFIADGVLRYAYFTATPAGWSISGTPMIANGKTTATFVPSASGTVSAGVTSYPDIAASLRFRGINDPTTYVAPTGTVVTATMTAIGATSSTASATSQLSSLSILSLSATALNDKGNASHQISVGPITNIGLYPATSAVTLKVTVPKTAGATVTYRNVTNTIPLPTGWSNVSVTNAGGTATITLTSTNTSLAPGASVPGLSFLAATSDVAPPGSVSVVAEATRCAAATASATITVT